MEPSQPEADAVALVVFDVELVPDRPPDDRIKLPARPPER